MQFKPITAIIVLSLVVASLLVAGCTNSTTNQTPSASATPSTATHDTFLEKYLAAFNATQHANKSRQIQAYELEWINSTSTRLQYTFVWKPSNYTNYTEAQDFTYMVFPTTQDATNYFNAMNKTNYSLLSTQYGSSGPYVDATGHTPQIYKNYRSNSNDAAKQILQADNIIAVGTSKILITSEPT